MDYIGSEVSHKLFGLGRVTRIRGNYVFVSFEGNEVKMFQFPRAFESVLKFTNPDLQSAALADHQSFLAEERQRLEEAAERRRRIEVNIDEELRQRFEKQKAAEARRQGRSGGASANAANLLFKIDVVMDPEHEDAPINAISYGDLEADSQAGPFTSKLMNERILYGGHFKSGQRKGQAVRMARVRPASLAVMTYREDNSPEEDRRIVAVFMVDDSFEGEADKSAWVQNKSKFFLKFSPEEQERLKLWPFFAHLNEKAPMRLVSSQYRYFEDREAALILREIIEVKSGQPDEALAQEFFDSYCELNYVDPKLELDEDDE